MVRNRCKQTTRGVDRDQLQQAANEVKEHHVSVRSVADARGIPKTTLQRYINASSPAKKDWRSYGNVADAQRIFSLQQETALADHIKSLDNLFHGLSAEQCRELAYRYGSANEVKTPHSWNKKGLAGVQAFSLLITFMYC